MLDADIQVKVGNLPQIRNAWQKGAVEGMRNAMLYAEMKSKQRIGTPGNIKTDTGNLRRSINSSVSVEGRGVVGKLGAFAIYARIHELGGVIRPRAQKYLRFPIGKKWVSAREVVIPPRPYLRPAITENMDKITEIIIKSIKSKLEGLK